MKSGNRLRLWIMGLIVAALVFTDIVPMFVQAQETIQLAQQEQPRKRRTLMDLLFGDKPEQQPPAATRRQQQQQQQAPRRPRKPQADLPPPKPKIEKAPDATRVAIFGDSLAIDLGKALERFYAEDPNLSILSLGVADSGLVRQNYFDWDKAIGEQISANGFDLAIIMIGVNDRQTLKVDGKSYKALTEGWNAIYTTRVNAVLNRLRAAGKPTIWVGLPPMEAPTYSTAMGQITAIQRLASFSGGAEFLDIYDRFADEDGKYSAYGPDLTGKSVQIRKKDGTHFSNAGAAKLAFYVSQSIKTFYRSGGVGIEVADPLRGTDAQTMVRPPYQGLGQIRQLEVAGAVISLSGSPTRAGDLLTAGGTPASTNPGFDLDLLVKAPVGRADAFGVGVAPQAEPANIGGR
jgi:hypothetical protein